MRSRGCAIALWGIVFTGIALAFLPVVANLPLAGLSFLATGFDRPPAEQMSRQYLTAISNSDAAAARQLCQYAGLTNVEQEIRMWGGAEIRDLQFSPLVREAASYGPTRRLDVRFSYQRPGQTAWEQGLLRMFWRFRDGTFWTIPSSETCQGSNGYYGD